MGLFHNEAHQYWCSGVLGGEYVIGDPEPLGPFTSVTTALDSLDKPAIPRWAAKRVAETAVWKHAVVGEMIAAGGEATTFEWLKGVPWNERDKAAERGTNAHLIAEALANGVPVSDEEKASPRVQQYLRFLDEWHPQFVGVEQQVINFTHGYAGTADIFAAMPTGPDNTFELWLLDIKTSDLDKSGPYRDMWLQLAALNGAEWWGWPDREDLVEAQHATRFGILQLADDHYNLWSGNVGPAEFDAFVHIKRTHDWIEGPLKLVKQGKVKPA